MELLGIYGKIIHEYEGDGSVTLDTGQIFKCSIRAVQLADGRIMASCRFSEDINSVLLCLNKQNSFTSIKGVTKDGWEFIIGGHLSKTASNFTYARSESTTIDIVFTADIVKLTKYIDRDVKSVKFGITNFEFLGNKFTEYPNGGALDTLSVTLGDNTVEIHAVKDYKIITQLIRAQRGIDVTSEMEVKIASITDLDIIIPMIDALCMLLSLARGTKINWIYYDSYDSLGEKISSSHNNNVAWQYARLPLIDPNNPNETADFVNQSFSAYLAHKDDLRIAIETYLDSKRETGYLEIRALRAVVVLEFLKSRYAKKKKLRKSFRAILETMFVELGISVTKGELDRFIKIRNSLVHEASFVTKEYWNEYAFLIGILDRIFLKILNYNGNLLDIANKFNRIDTTQP
jgi:hypothetical protein